MCFMSVGEDDVVPAGGGSRTDVGTLGARAARDIDEQAARFTALITVPCGWGTGFAVDTNEVTLIDSSAEEQLPLLPKYDVAHRVLDRVVTLLRERE